MRSSILYPRSSVIKSRTNSLIKLVRALRLKKHREESGLFFCEGAHVIDELLKSDWEVQQLLVTARMQEAFTQRATARGAAVTLIDDGIADYLTDAESSQGVIAVARARRSSLAELGAGHSVLAVLDRVSDPGNVGTIIRAAVAFGGEAIVLLEDCADPFNPKTVRATAGSVFQMSVVQSSVNELLTFTTESRVRLVVAAARDGRPPWEVELTGRVALVVGHEAHGVNEALTRAADDLVTIPLNARVESLNVATATSAILFEAARQRAVCG